MKEIFLSTEFWTFLGVALSGIIGYIGGKRKVNAEVDGIELATEKELLNTYKSELDYFSTQLTLTRKEIVELREQIEKIIKETCKRTECSQRIK